MLCMRVQDRDDSSVHFGGSAQKVYLRFRYLRKGDSTRSAFEIEFDSQAGLGLNDIVGEHGGTIKSRAQPGEYTEIMVSIPIR